VIAPFHGDAIAANEGANLVAVCDIDVPRAEAFAAAQAEKHGLPTPAVYRDYEEMVQRDDLDVVCICVYSGRHARVGIAAAQAGKHLLCEKPIDITLPNIDALIQAVDGAGVKLGVIFQRRTAPTSIKVWQAIRQGALGHLILGDAYLKYHRSHSYYASAGWRGTWELDGGGALMNQGVHGIDLLQWLMGVPVTSIFARAGALARNIPVEDTAVAVLQYANGAYGVIEGTTSLVSPGLETRHEIPGERGTIVLADSGIVKWDQDLRIGSPSA
jgi:predicted dehydrogenase